MFSLRPHQVKSVRLTPDSVCGMPRNRCASYSGITVRLAPDFAKSTEAHIVFDNAEHRLHIGGTVRSQTLSYLTGEVYSGSPAVFQ